MLRESRALDAKTRGDGAALGQKWLEAEHWRGMVQNSDMSCLSSYDIAGERRIRKSPGLIRTATSDRRTIQLCDGTSEMIILPDPCVRSNPAGRETAAESLRTRSGPKVTTRRQPSTSCHWLHLVAGDPLSPWRSLAMISCSYWRPFAGSGFSASEKIST